MGRARGGAFRADTAARGAGGQPPRKQTDPRGVAAAAGHGNLSPFYLLSFLYFACLHKKKAWSQREAELEERVRQLEEQNANAHAKLSELQQRVAEVCSVKELVPRALADKTQKGKTYKPKLLFLLRVAPLVLVRAARWTRG